MSESANQFLIDCPVTACEPGSTLEGTAYWDLTEPPEVVYIRTVWWTEGRGDRDEAIIDLKEWTTGSTVGKEAFRVTLPDWPCSFSGKLISLCWGIVLEAQRGDVPPVVHRLTVGPGGRETILHTEVES
ncbi:MAG: hypothetical protein ACFE0O_03115 [Opitutales bacterium]